MANFTDEKLIVYFFDKFRPARHGSPVYKRNYFRINALTKADGMIPTMDAKKVDAKIK